MNKFLVSSLCALVLCGCTPRCDALGLPGMRIVKKIGKRIRQAPSAGYNVSPEAKERVINLPQDADGWHISIVGSKTDAAYRRLLIWFSTDAGLTDLRRQVHFQSVESSTKTYESRFAPNITALPTVRVQEGSEVLYEVAGNDIPATADKLYAAIAYASRPLLPWRKEIEKQCCPKPVPVPILDIDIPVDVPVVIDGPPKFIVRRVLSAGSIIGLALCSLIAGLALGLVSWWKKTYPKQ